MRSSYVPDEPPSNYSATGGIDRTRDAMDGSVARSGRGAAGPKAYAASGSCGSSRPWAATSPRSLSRSTRSMSRPFDVDAFVTKVQETPAKAA